MRNYKHILKKEKKNRNSQQINIFNKEARYIKKSKEILELKIQ